MQTKLCNVCNLEKPLDEFSIKIGTRKQPYCKQCQKEHYNSEYHKRHNLKKYGISLEEYNDILTSQRGGCAICGASPGKRSLAVDHSHDTGAVRGLLCFQCNQVLGLMDERPILFRLAALYLERAEAKRKAAATEVEKLLQGLKQ